MLGGRSPRMILSELFEPGNYRALLRMPRVYVHPVLYMRRYFLGGGDYPTACALRTPLGQIAPILYSHHDVFTVNEIFCRGDYELPDRSEVVVDVGSNIGLSALYFLTRSPNLRCYLFEPDPRNVERLKQNLVGYEERYQLSEAAVADQDGMVEFGRERTGRYGGIGIESDDRFQVRCLSINGVIREVLGREAQIDLLKIDTEGIENATVLAIEPELHARIRAIVFETKQPVNPASERYELSYANETCRLTSVDDSRPPAVINPDLPARLRIQFAITRRVTRALKSMGLREPLMSLRLSGRRGLRRLFERAGSARLSRPALHEMDAKLDELFDQDGGTFVEAGGFDGYTQSNTYYLERFRGWRGILVEPMPELAAEARLNRPGAQVFQCALVAGDFEADEIEMEFGELMSTVQGVHEDNWAAQGVALGWRDQRVERVPARTLSQILDAAGVEEVDLLSLDVEGYEAQALRGLDLERHAPRWIVVEMHDLVAGRAEIGPLLEEHYVEHGELSPLDILYRRRDVKPPGSAGKSSRHSRGTARITTTSTP